MASRTPGAPVPLLPLWLPPSPELAPLSAQVSPCFLLSAPHTLLGQCHLLLWLQPPCPAWRSARPKNPVTLWSSRPGRPTGASHPQWPSGNLSHSCEPAPPAFSQLKAPPSPPHPTTTSLPGLEDETHPPYLLLPQTPKSHQALLCSMHPSPHHPPSILRAPSAQALPA